MAGGGLLALLDDITTLLDDIAVLSKAAATKTAGITGDDLAVNSQALIGIDPTRELPVVWSVAKGSLKNKMFLIPGALALNWALPAAITPILMLGGAYLCYEGMEKIIHSLRGEDHEHHHDLTAAALQSPEALLKFESDKIRSAIQTDLILSGEIIVITLGTVAAAPFATQVTVLTLIGVGITVVIYGLVAGIVKLDDLGLHLSETGGTHLLAKTSRTLGKGLVQAAPKILKFLGVVGTAAMLLVGGELILHGIPGTEQALHAFSHTVSDGSRVQAVVGMAAAVITGILAGLAAIPAVKALGGFVQRAKKTYAGFRKMR